MWYGAPGKASLAVSAFHATFCGEAVVTAFRREPAEKYSPAGKSSGRGRYTAPDKARERCTDDLSGDLAGKEKPRRRHRCFDPPPVTTSRRALYSQGAPYSRAELFDGGREKKNLHADIPRSEPARLAPSRVSQTAGRPLQPRRAGVMSILDEKAKDKGILSV